MWAFLILTKSVITRYLLYPYSDGFCQVIYGTPIDQKGKILECYVLKCTDKKAARKVLLRLISKHGQPKKIVTDKLPSYKIALKELRIMHLQNTDQYLNNQCENSHLHFRRQEKMMNKFLSHKSLQKFTSIHATFLDHFNYQRHIEIRQNFRNLRQDSIESWSDICIG